MIKDIYKGIKNIIKWMPLVWRDRDWDYHYFLQIMKFKLNNMNKELKNSEFLAYTDTKAIKALKICVNLLDRLDKDEYNDNSIYKLMDKIPNVWDRDKDYEHPKGYHRAFKREIDKAFNLRQKDKEYFNELFKKYLDTWWD